jgi:hypothetical protein
MSSSPKPTLGEPQNLYASRALIGRQLSLALRAITRPCLTIAFKYCLLSLSPAAWARSQQGEKVEESESKAKAAEELKKTAVSKIQSLVPNSKRSAQRTDTAPHASLKQPGFSPRKRATLEGQAPESDKLNGKHEAAPHDSEEHEGHHLHSNSCDSLHSLAEREQCRKASETKPQKLVNTNDGKQK